MNPLEDSFKIIRDTVERSPIPAVNTRKENLARLRAELIIATPKLIEALSMDYGHRSAQDTLIADITPCISNIDYTLAHIDEWTLPSKRDAGVLLEATSEVEVYYQPKGVVGIITPWNFPILLSIEPLIAAISAGNRAMIKLSELTPKLNKVLKKMLAKVFEESEVVVIEGESNVGAAFSALPFEHLFFTGSPTVGKLVMKAAASNLTPVTLELGGKSPVIIDRDISMSQAVERIICGKSLNSGQVCVAPDYVLLPEGRDQEFIDEYATQFSVLYPEGVDSVQWTSVINNQQFARINGLLESETNLGKAVTAVHDNALDAENHRMVTHIVLNPDLDSTLMQEEIFGPILPVITYGDLNEALALISSKAKPLALYLMSDDVKLQDYIKRSMYSGGMCINDSIFHIAADDAPFGGIGGSGMGNYHGKEGFLTFSHAKTVLKTHEKYNMKALFMPGENEFKSAMTAYFD